MSNRPIAGILLMERFVVIEGSAIVPGEYHARISMGPSGSGRERHGFEVVDGGQPPGADAMRALRRLHAASVTVVTTVTGQGFRGVTVNAFSIVSLAPPRVLVCLGRGSEACDAVVKTGRYAVSVLSDRQEFLADRFAGRAPLVDSQFTGVKYRLTVQGMPVLEECLVWFDCKIVASQDWGDHYVLFGEVIEAGYGTGGDPLLYFDGAYHFLAID